jgi:hypothetical protein
MKPFFGNFNMNRWLIAAGVYNLVWGSLVVFAPNLFFQLGGLELPNYKMIWQSVGMIVGVYGVGYIIAAQNPNKHWVIVFVGLLGKVFGVAGFTYYYLNGVLPLEAGLVILFNDAVWIIPFYLIIFKVFKSRIQDFRFFLNK